MDWYFGVIDGALNGNVCDTVLLVPIAVGWGGAIAGMKALVDRLPKSEPKPRQPRFKRPDFANPQERTLLDVGGWFLSGRETTHVYYFYDRQGNLLYVGITNDLKRRWAQHEADKPWWHLVARKESVQYPTREEAEKVEAHQIRTLRPQFNRALNGWFS